MGLRYLLIFGGLRVFCYFIGFSVFWFLMLLFDIVGLVLLIVRGSICLVWFGILV